jgi:tRNA U34 5-methylaminomethyl-2-thiouridine-forming methyltransferase MnmC
VSFESAPAAGEWRAQRTEDGSWTLVHPGHGQACHSLHGAWTQARERYASAIGDLPRECVSQGRVRLLDIGTGLGLNLAAAVEACEARGWCLDATSFELDPRVVRAAADLEPVGACHARILEALAATDERSIDSPPLAIGAHRLRWLVGDAREQLPRLASEFVFDIVFLDPFSPGIDPALWEPEFLAEVARRMAPGARLATYTTAMRVRVALARAGLNVGSGPRVGRKAAGTLASRGGAVPPLDPRTQRRLERARAV